MSELYLRVAFIQYKPRCVVFVEYTLEEDSDPSGMFGQPEDPTVQLYLTGEINYLTAHGSALCLLQRATVNGRAYSEVTKFKSKQKYIKTQMTSTFKHIKKEKGIPGVALSEAEALVASDDRCQAT